MQKEAQKEKKSRRITDSKEKKDQPEEEMAAIKVAHTVQQQIKDFKVIEEKRITLN